MLQLLLKVGRKVYTYQRNVSAVFIHSYHLWAFSVLSYKFYINIYIVKVQLNKDEF